MLADAARQGQPMRGRASRWVQWDGTLASSKIPTRKRQTAWMRTRRRWLRSGLGSLLELPWSTRSLMSRLFAWRWRWLLGSCSRIMLVVLESTGARPPRNGATAGVSAYSLFCLWWRDLFDFMCVRRAELSGLVQRLQTPQRYPTYYRRPFHAYESGNLCWEAAFEVEAASLALTLRYWPNEVCVCMYVYTHPSTHAPATHATRTGEARKAESSRSAGQDATRHSRSRQSVLAHSASTRSRAKHGARESGCDVYTTAA